MWNLAVPRNAKKKEEKRFSHTIEFPQHQALCTEGLLHKKKKKQGEEELSAKLSNRAAVVSSGSLCGCALGGY